MAEDVTLGGFGGFDEVHDWGLQWRVGVADDVTLGGFGGMK